MAHGTCCTGEKSLWVIPIYVSSCLEEEKMCFPQKNGQQPWLLPLWVGAQQVPSPLFLEKKALPWTILIFSGLHLTLFSANPDINRVSKTTNKIKPFKTVFQIPDLQTT